MKDQKNKVSAISLAISLAFIGFLAFVQAGKYLNSLSLEIRSEAVNTCYQVATVETKQMVQEDDKELYILEPVNEIYANCLRDKGLEPTQAQ